jgi:hypothetical protein
MSPCECTVASTKYQLYTAIIYPILTSSTPRHDLVMYTTNLAQTGHSLQEAHFRN